MLFVCFVWPLERGGIRDGVLLRITIMFLRIVFVCEGGSPSNLELI